MKQVLIAALSLSLVWCTPPVPTPIEPEPLPPAPASCASMCDRMRQLGCEEGKPTDGGASCEMVCENAEQSPVPMPVACMAQARSCAQVPDCSK